MITAVMTPEIPTAAIITPIITPKTILTVLLGIPWLSIPSMYHREQKREIIEQISLAHITYH